jgi:hypothetical protein
MVGLIPSWAHYSHPAGFELYTDLVLADFLVSCTPFVGAVVFQYACLSVRH